MIVHDPVKPIVDKVCSARSFCFVWSNQSAAIFQQPYDDSVINNWKTLS